MNEFESYGGDSAKNNTMPESKLFTETFKLCLFSALLGLTPIISLRMAGLSEFVNEKYLASLAQVLLLLGLNAHIRYIFKESNASRLYKFGAFLVSTVISIGMATLVIHFSANV